MPRTSSRPRWARRPDFTPAHLVAPAYFAVYLAWLFAHQESELEHWPTLVFLPLALVYLGHRLSGESFKDALGSLGLGRARWSRGLLVAAVLGAGVGVYQTLGSQRADEVMDAIRTGRIVWALPLGFVVMLVFAGFTEEFFFRGFLQTRLESLFRSRVAGLVVTSLCFGVYHLPYAYYNPRWSSAGDWGAAWEAALSNGVLGGLLLGGLYLYSGRNLLAPVVLHSMIGAFPAMGVIRFGGG